MFSLNSAFQGVKKGQNLSLTRKLQDVYMQQKQALILRIYLVIYHALLILLGFHYS